MGVIRQRQHNWALQALLVASLAVGACGRQNNATGAPIPLSGGGATVAAIGPTNPIVTPTPVAVGTLSVQVGGIKAGIANLDAVIITLNGAGLLMPLSKRLTLAELANQNTIGFEQVPSGVKTLNVQAVDATGMALGQQVLEVIVPARGTRQVAATVAAGSAPNAVLVQIQENPVATTPAAVGSARPSAAPDERSLSVEVTGKRAVRKMVLVKTLELNLRVINRSRTDAFAGVVTVQFRKNGGLLSRDNSVVETKTTSIPRLAPGQEHLVTLQSSKAADDADVSVHTVLDTQQASTRAVQ